MKDSEQTRSNVAVDYAKALALRGSGYCGGQVPKGVVSRIAGKTNTDFAALPTRPIPAKILPADTTATETPTTPGRRSERRESRWGTGHESIVAEHVTDIVATEGTRPRPAAEPTLPSRSNGARLGVWVYG